MGVDLTGGLDAAREYVLTEPPTAPGTREAVNLWIWDDRGEIGFPRVAAEAVAPGWSTHEMAMTLCFADGRILKNSDPGPAHSVIGPEGLPTRFGVGPMAFEFEPFKRYRTTFKGTALDTTFDALLKGAPGDRRVDLEYEVECEPAVPPWVQGTMSGDAKDRMATGIEAEFMGGVRLEQLVRAKGRVKVGGQEHSFTGGALRVRRTGVRRFSDFWGHCWQSALFPSGRGFGYIAYPPKDGVESYNEGFLYLGDGELIPARVVEAPWLTRFDFKGQDLSMVFESRLGRTRIEGELALAAPSVSPAGAPIAFPPLMQSIGRFTWDGETAYGMTERSSLRERITGLD
jgi:hypothetical protein